MIPRFEFPRKLNPLLQPSRYKGIYGGRGGAKSNFFADLLIKTCCMEKTDAVCLREVQRTLDQSVKKLLEQKIQTHNVGYHFEVMSNRIRCRNGGLIIFNGMQDHTADSIKSLEGFKIAWFEEAHRMSQRSLSLLRPTIRMPESELWFNWNPESRDDPIDVFLRGENPPEDMILVESNYFDNPWFPDVLEQERLLDLKTNQLYHDHIWLGHYNIDPEGLVYKYFDRVTHHTDRTITNNDPYLHIGQDFNVGGCCSTVFLIDGINAVAVDEYVTKDTRDLILTTQRRYPNKTVTFYPDASGDNAHTNASETDISLLLKAGFSVRHNPANPLIRDRVNSVNELLVRGRLSVNTSTCKHLTHAFENQVYDEKGVPEKFTVHPAIDDRVDSAGYFIANKFPIITPIRNTQSLR